MRNTPEESGNGRAQRGSAMIMAIFVLILLTGMGSVLLFLSQSEVKMSSANLRAKSAFYLSEAGLEAGRSQLWDTNRAGDFDDDLVDAAGPDGTMDFDADAISATYDSAGNVTGFTGYNDDEPVSGPTPMGDGMYIVFLTNDPIEINASPPKPLDDDDDTIMLTGIGAGSDGSFEVVQAIIELNNVLPELPPATITMLGPMPVFEGGKASTKEYIGDDCHNHGGGNGQFKPVVGGVGGTAEASIESGGYGGPDYEAGGFTTPPPTIADLETIADANLNVLDPSWSNCATLQAMAQTLALVADYTCSGSCTIPAGPPGQIIVANGDVAFDSGEDGYGTLLVTGTFTARGNWSWDGLILVIGEGQFRTNGGGNGERPGAMVIADIAGPDDIYGNADDCTGGIAGFDVPTYDERGGGNSYNEYCSESIRQSYPADPYEIREFMQR